MQAMNALGGAAMAGGMPGAPAQDFTKLYKAEKESLQLVNHAWVCDDVEDRFLTMCGVL